VHEFRGMVGNGHPIEVLELVPSGGGVFDVHADGALIFSKHKVHRHATPAEVIAAIRSRLG
jgi:hypothetical protein